MPTVSRNDGPMTWHHVMNRGLSHRVVFETREDVRSFLSLLASSVRRGEIELHAYSFLPTHYHLLVRSLRGELSRSMMRVQNIFVRRFNRRRGRDGPLFNGRFRSKAVTSDVYWRTLIRYIDLNAVSAALVARPEDYPYCSAIHYARPSGPPWLARYAVENAVLSGANSAKRNSKSSSAKYNPSAYESTFGARGRKNPAWLVEQRLNANHAGDDPLDFLIGATPDRTRRWMKRQIRLADGEGVGHGEGVGQVLVDPGSVLDRIAKHRSADPRWLVVPFRMAKSGWVVLTAGLLRMLCGLGGREIGRKLGCSEVAVCRYIKDHQNLFMNDAGYAVRVSEITNEALQACFKHSMHRR